MNIFDKSVKIGNVSWNIEKFSHADTNEQQGGCTNVFYHTIYMREEGGMEDIDTLIHETLHACDAMMTIKLKEDQVYKLANALTFVLRDNPWLFTYVKQKIKEEYVR